MYGVGRAVDGDERGVRTGEEAMETAHAASCTLRTRGITGKPALVLDRPGGVPQGNGASGRVQSWPTIKKTGNNGLP